MATRPQRKRNGPSDYAAYYRDDNIVVDLLPGQVLESEVEDDTPPPKPPKPPKRRASKMEREEEDLAIIDADPSRSQSISKRGLGRPRKPDHLLRRPRRPRGEGRKKLKSEASEDKINQDMTIEEMTMTFTERPDDQAIIADQQRQIENMQEKLRQYEARIKAMENGYFGYFGSTPPTPAMSIINSSSHAHPARNPIVMPYGNAALEQADREDSPLSVYSDLGLPELFGSIRGPQGSGRPAVQEASRQRSKGQSHIVVLKVRANPVDRPVRITYSPTSGYFTLGVKPANFPSSVRDYMDRPRGPSGGEIKETTEKNPSMSE